MPRWKLARRSCACAADRAGTGGGGAADALLTVPGTRFACGTRTGSPAAVVPPDTGDCATSAARQPSSAGDDQVSAGAAEVSTGSAAPGRSAPCLLRRNQSDSTDSKIGSRFSSAAFGAGGMITSGDSALASDGSVASPGPGASSSPASTVAGEPGGAPSTGRFPFPGAGAVATPPAPAEGMAAGSARPGGELAAAVPAVSNRRSPAGTAAVS